MSQQRDQIDMLGAFREAIAELGAPRSSESLMYCGSSLAGRPPVGSRLNHPTTVPIYPEINLCLAGNVEVLTPAGRLRLPRGDLLLMDAGVEHGEVLSPDSTAAYFHIHKTNAHVYLWSAGEMSLLDLIGGTDLAAITGALGRECVTRDWRFSEAASALLLYLSTILMRRLRRNSLLFTPKIGPVASFRDGDSRVWRAIESALQQCTARLHEHVSAEDLGAATGYSVVHLNRLLVEHLGRTISQHLRELRMVRAMDMLTHSPQTIENIAHAVGYTEHANFRRAFRRATGVTPGQYRRGRRSARQVRDIAAERD
jgi:AraC-like DNA-binding protein